MERNIVLIAMPGAGKTTIGKVLAKELKLNFIDVDEEFKKMFNLSTAEDIEKNGLNSFRDRESQTVFKVAKVKNAVIATGGGAVLKEENRKALKENGIIVYIERDIDKLDVKDRPVSKNNDLKTLFSERKAIYEGFADIKVKNDGTIEQAVKRIIDKLKQEKKR